MSMLNMNFLLSVGPTIGICVVRKARLGAGVAAAVLPVRSFHATQASFGGGHSADQSPTAPKHAVRTKRPDIANPPKHELFNKILIANRGEIACRIMRTCKRLGIQTVAVHSEVDAQTLHVQLADEAYCVGPAPTNDSYRNATAIIDAVRQSGAQAVHPGYGFLSENNHFAAQLEQLGVTFIGPHSGAIDAMGDKIHSKILATEAKVNVIPGYNGVVKDADHAIKIAQEIGYPVMVKASGGGGGKGMRVAWNDEEVREGFKLSAAEAASSFGDDRLFVEKFIDNPRHIEIQVLGDNHGNVVYLNERECSIQRRNQKVIEEAPSSFIDPETRAKMGQQAVMLAKAVKYNSAGTVEMMVDSKRNFYFLEMNTRLQVEHPITEYITGVDLVEQMIRSAANRPLSFTQADVKLNGWAFESRVYAEDPTRFLPSIGKLQTYAEPVDYTGQNLVRCDSGIVEGSNISIYYDPMICKLITYGPDRQSALQTMREALDSYVIRGVTHNIPILRDMIDHPRFISGDISTKFIQEEYPTGFAKRELKDLQLHHLLSTAAALKATELVDNVSFQSKVARQDVVSEVASGVEAQEYVVLLDGAPHRIILSSVEGMSQVEFEDGSKLAVSEDSEAPTNHIRVRHFIVEEPCEHEDEELVDETAAASEDVEFEDSHDHISDVVTIQNLGSIPGGFKIGYLGGVYDVVFLTPREYELSKLMPKKAKADTSMMVVSPMPGTVVTIAVAAGDSVVAGQEVAVVEAMKMQNSLRAQRTGKIKKVFVKPGQTLASEELIMEFEKE